MNFYLQDSRTYCGNDLMFWAKGGKGYTTNVSLAQVFTQEQALAQNRARPSDIPWPCDYIERHTRLAVDHQDVKLAVAMARCGLTLSPMPSEPPPDRYRCEGCGVFISAVDYYTGPCRRCNQDNRP